MKTPYFLLNVYTEFSGGRFFPNPLFYSEIICYNGENNKKEGVSMRTIQAAALTEAVAGLCIQANTHLPPDIAAALDHARQREPWPLAKETLGLLWDNLELAEEKVLPIS